jgi:hypothetical protein
MEHLSNTLNNIFQCLQKEYINYDCFSQGQLRSKEWAAIELRQIQLERQEWYPTVFILCGWYGLMATMLRNYHVDFKVIRSFDIDEKACRVADKMNKCMTDNSWSFKAIPEDIFNINYEGHTWQFWSNKNNRMSYPITDIPDLIINTSCEHTKRDWFDKIPKGKIMLLQSNDFFSGKDHINCVFELNEMRDMFPLSKTYYYDTLELPDYNRFMLIGEV